MPLPRRVRGQLTGDRLGMTSLKISSVSWEPTRPTHDQLRIVELIPEAHTLSVDLLSPSCNRHLASLGVVELINNVPAAVSGMGSARSGESTSTVVKGLGAV